MNCEDVEMPFGKHKGETLGEILQTDPTYLDWLQDADIRSDSLAEAIEEMNEKYTAEIDRAIEDQDH
jgi:uncharacterized protein (DUF3820 family)